jgi:hypothetical protein
MPSGRAVALCDDVISPEQCPDDPCGGSPHPGRGRPTDQAPERWGLVPVRDLRVGGHYVREQAEIVVPVPMQVLGEQLQQVETWPEFVVGLESVIPVAHQRHLFGIRQGARLHEILMAVRPQPADGRYGWTAIDGPRWDGSLRPAG